MRLLVLGAGGGVGTHVVRQAIARGHELTTLLRPERTLDLPSEVRVVRGTFDDPAALAEAVTEVEAVLTSHARGRGRRQ